MKRIEALWNKGMHKLIEWNSMVKLEVSSKLSLCFNGDVSVLGVNLERVGMY